MSERRSVRLADLGALRPLFGELNDLKRVRDAGRAGSLAERGFLRAWSDLVSGDDPREVTLREVGSAVVAARLGGIDRGVLLRGGLTVAEATGVLLNSLEAWSGAIDTGLGDGLRSRIAEEPKLVGYRAEPPAWARTLANQPRAGATRPGRPRIVLEPPESHAEHCYLTAVYAAIVAPAIGADPVAPFLAGLAHHLHNASLPDSGFAGEELLGDHLAPLMRRFTDEAIAGLPAPLAAAIREARGLLDHAETPEARAFHAGDVLDRVLQMEQYARVAAFELRQALVDLDLVHPGPLQAFHLEVLGATGLLP